MKTRMLIFSLIAIMAASGFWLYKNNKKKKVEVTPQTTTDTSVVPDYSGIQVKDVFIKDLRTGKGATVTASSNVKVAYEAWVYDPASLGNKGKLLFSKEEFKSVGINLKSDTIIPGLKKGLQGMKVGGLRQLVVPDNLAYGEKGLENKVPPKAILLFEIELLSANQISEPHSCRIFESVGSESVECFSKT